MKHVIWSNDVGTISDIAEHLRYVDPDLSENDAWMCAIEDNDGYLSDELENLNVDVGSDIVAIADLGLWNGRRTACKVIGSNLKDCMSVPVGDYIDWYVEDGDVKIRDCHHDGTNIYVFRAWKDGVKDGEKEVALNLIIMGAADASFLYELTRPLGDYVKNVYGWDD